MNNTMAWEKWDEADFIREALSEDEELEEALENPDLPSMNLGSFSVTFPKIRTPLGFFSIDDPLRPAVMFDCWIGHTNFRITEDIKRLIEEVPGIEALKIMSQYRFFIGVGKLFKFRDVCQQIQEALGTTSEEEDGYDQSHLLEIIKTQLKSYQRWAIFYSKEGLLEYAASNEEEDAEFDATVSKFTEDENFTVIKSEDEE
jgi:hypothetical protein